MYLLSGNVYSLHDLSIRARVLLWYCKKGLTFTIVPFKGKISTKAVRYDVVPGTRVHTMVPQYGLSPMNEWHSRIMLTANEEDS